MRTVSHGKVTPAVRKILQSQKTFANHLSDAEALAALAATNPQSHAQPSLGIASAPSAAAARGSPAPATAPPKRSHKKKDRTVSAAAAAATTPLRRVSAAGELLAPVKAEKPDVVMAEVPTLAEPDPGFKPHPGDRDPLLKSRVPAMPGREEVAALVRAPALTYLEARARGGEGAGAGTGPPRRFCEMCGYWGRVRCTKCGTRVCALECLRSHQEECYTRYGA
jgi:zinc finger HIT domain-containing protein 1